ncbi:Multidrug and toxin extrusion protein 1 [Nibea albiflora]|uniref:Multidrug and toxin extrusion protein 1 n=1 Tax=Nibea albiflora TaxID=240163 RepID=A0ACB7EII4_NIBAL|nr:Multidrug and toxin extrusion protein 1 [Nibea albiflora]
MGEMTDTSAKGPALASRTADMEVSSDKLFCCRWVRHRVPLAHREELYYILRMTGPLLLSRILNYLLPFVVTMFCGRLGNEVMAGYGLASATINVTTAATGYGLGLACDTLVSQTFGGKNLLRVGVILQRGIIILLLFCLPCWGLLINAQAILLCLGQDPEVTSGSAAANALSQIYICAFLFAYIWWKKLHVTTWGGWSVESLQEWGSYMKLAIPSTLMKCFEWWVYELGGFFAAGMLSEDELAAQHAVIMVAFITYMFPLGIQAAACARVGNALGAGDTARAILTSKVSLTLAGFWLGLLICVVLQSTFYITVIFKLNWERMTEEAVDRAQKNTHMTLLNTADQTATNGSSVDGFTSTSTVCHDRSTETQQLKDGRLSTTQLILRRGLTLFAAVSLLAVGLSAHFLVSRPQMLSSQANFTLDWINTTYTPDQIFSTVLVPDEESH